MNLATKYLGLALAHPFMSGESPLTGDVAMVKRLEDGGSAAIVLPSIFEEQLTMAASRPIHHRDSLDSEFATLLAGFSLALAGLNHPPLGGPEQYLEHIHQARSAVRVPVIASLNGISGETWLKCAFDVEQAVADAVELNLDEMAIDPHESSLAVEARIRNAVVELKRGLKIPLAIKLTPFFTAFANLVLTSSTKQARTGSCCSIDSVIPTSTLVIS